MPHLRNGTSNVSSKLINMAVASQSCLTCKNFKATHKDTKISYCTDGSKSVFKDSGCTQWSQFK